MTTCHLILHLRQVRLADDPSSSGGPLRSSFLRYASKVVGNLSAPLDLDRQFDFEAELEGLSPCSSANPLADGLADTPGPLQEAEPAEYVIVHALVLVDTESGTTHRLSTLELGDVFNDPEHGRRVLSMVQCIDFEEDNGTQGERTDDALR